MKFRTARWGAAVLSLLPSLALAADMDGAQLSVLWGVPFAGILLSIAIIPLVAPIFWYHHFGKVSAAWALAFLLPFAVVFGPGAAGAGVVHALLAEYIPFIILLTALFTVAGGIYIKGNLRGSPGLNTGILAIGAVLASFMGTTGASMLLIRPLIRANDNRKHVVHVVVFFIFIVSNAGGSLTPLGDPPLFLGFLKGVEFSWTLMHLFPETLFLVGILLALFYALDWWYYHRKEEIRTADPTPDDRRFGFDGGINFLLLAGVVGLVLMSGLWKSAVVFNIAGTEVGLPGIVRDLGLIAITLASLQLTPGSVHADNQFSWGPMQEVAKLFAGIAYGLGYRASVYLTDGTFLPCVMFRNPKTVVNLAIRRFKEEQSGKSIFSRSSGLGYYNIVKNFVTNGNCINDYDVDRVEKSKFAFPLTIQSQIRGETTMGWTGFAAKMRDGKYFGFGTNFLFEFFQMPEGYSVDDIEEIINHSYVLKTGELRSHKVPFFEHPDDYKDAIIHRERPYFECYIDNL